MTPQMLIWFGSWRGDGAPAGAEFNPMVGRGRADAQPFVLSSAPTRAPRCCYSLQPAAMQCRTVSYVIHLVKGDATNSVPGRHSNKAHVCAITTTFGLPPDSPDVDESSDGSQLEKPHLQHTTWTHLQKVPKNCTAMLQRAIFLRQIESVGIRTWLDSPAVLMQFPVSSRHVHLECWSFSTDAGGEQTIA